MRYMVQMLPTLRRQLLHGRREICNKGNEMSESVDGELLPYYDGSIIRTTYAACLHAGDDGVAASEAFGMLRLKQGGSSIWRMNWIQH